VASSFAVKCRRALARHLGLALFPAARPFAGLRVAMGNLIEGCRSASIRTSPTYSFGLFDLLNPFALLSGW